MSMAAGARSGARVLQQLRSPTPFFSRAQLLPSSSSSSSSCLTPSSSSRGFASDHHGPARVNIWDDPMSPAKWKEEQFVLLSLAGWGLVFYGGYKAATGGKKKDT
ncbi:unnamed protein product [Calypogeia fissa]